MYITSSVSQLVSLLIKNNYNQNNMHETKQKRLVYE